MKKTNVILCLLLTAALWPLPSVQAGTNDYNSTLTGPVIEQRLSAVTNIQKSVSNLVATGSAGLADIGFVNQTISAAFTNANFTLTDLSSYVGTNVARVTLQFYGIAATTVSLRTYGDTNTVDDTSMNSVAIAAGSTADMTVNTDSAGRIDIKATGNTKLSLIGFIRRHVFQ